MVEEIVWLATIIRVLKNTSERCRSRVNHDFLANGEYLQTKRFNWGVHTLNLGQIALRAIKNGGTKKDFDKALEWSFDLMEKAILFRFNHVKGMEAKDAPILFMYGGIARMNPDETFEHMLRSDQSSVSFGYMGIDDATRIFTGETIKDENDKYTELSGQTYGAIKAITDHNAQRTSHQRNTLEYISGRGNNLA